MATCEKPKQKKHKKPKERNKKEILDTQNDDTFPVVISPTTSNSDKSLKTILKNEANEETTLEEHKTDEVASTSADALKELAEFESFAEKTKRIISLDCSIASDSKDEVQDKGYLEYSTENISLHDELANVLKSDEDLESLPEAELKQNEATAPPAEGLESNKKQLTSVYVDPIIQYPNLLPLQQVESSAQVVYQRTRLKSPGFSIAESELQPFSKEQLKQFYHCAELDLVKHFEVEFLTNSLLETYEDDPLYSALLEYYNLQSKLTMNLHDIEAGRRNCSEKQENIWVKESRTATGHGKCFDNVDLKASMDYEIMVVNRQSLQEASNALENLFSVVCNNYITNRVTAAMVRVKINQLIDKMMSHRGTSTLPSNINKPALLPALIDDKLDCITELRKAVSILFHFIRKPSPNKVFAKDLKSWLTQLVSLHLLLATREDHWFLLFNLLRCPSGIGSWAAGFLQVPCNTVTSPSSSLRPLQLNSPEINLCVSILQILLLPIQKRSDYLKAFSQEERWILIDSDGEDCYNSSGQCNGLKESDLVALLNQVPFERLFCSVLHIEKFLGDYIIDEGLISSNRMLKVIAFFSNLIEIFGEGMLTYNVERYKQLAKRLGRFVRHTLQYVLDYHELFLSNKGPKEAASCERIVVELNSLLLKACSYIHRTRNLSTWQFFSSIPYQCLYSDTIWQLFYHLNVGFPAGTSLPNKDYTELLQDRDFWNKFNIANADSSDEDLYFLLQAFFEMANGRDKQKDWDLIKTIGLHIFNVGFVNKSTRESCYKTSRDMLVNLSLSYEDLLSCLLFELKIRFNDIENEIYLFKNLPFENWKPGMDSFEILSNWLLNFDYKSRENMLARLIISHLNWSFDYDGRLFLPHNIHVRMACLITDALSKHAAETVGLSGISEGVRQVTNLMDFSQATKENFSSWCWSMVSILRLHLMDQNVESIKRTLQNPTEPLMFVPDLERVEMIDSGVRENRPLSMFVGILVTLHGHSIPLICQKGFELMKMLMNDYRHAAVIRCIELIVPLFLDIPETLANCESFHVILNGLLNADKSYLKMAKDIIYANSIGPVVELLDQMIHHQITSYPSYGLTSPLNLINVWLNCLTSLPNWQTTSVVYLLDKILRLSYQFPDARFQAVEFFRNYYKDCEDWKGSNKLTALKTFFGANQSKIPALSPQHAWLSLMLLEIEYQRQDITFWSEFLRQMSNNLRTVNVDLNLKKTLNIVKFPQFQSQFLVLYKYANLIAGMEINHPLFPIVNQKFFELYLSRIPLHYDEENFQDIYGVSDKFYEHNVPLMKKVKANIKAAEAFYNNEALKCANDDSLSFFYRNCGSIMKTYSIWLEDTAINKISRNSDNFPPQYNNEKLREILNGNSAHWTEFIYLPNIRKEQKNQADRWAMKTFRYKNTKVLRKAIQSQVPPTPIARIKQHLSSYDERVEPPTYFKPNLNIPKEINRDTLGLIKQHLSVLRKTAEEFQLKSSELNALNRNYLDKIIELYKLIPCRNEKQETCESIFFFNRKCLGAARIEVITKVIKKDPLIESDIKNYQERHDILIDKLLEFQADNFAQSVDKLNSVSRLLLSYQSIEANANDVIKKTGIDFFYTVTHNMTETTLQFDPTNNFFSQLLNELGIFIQDNQEQEGETILKMAIKEPKLIKVLSGVFVPYRTAPSYFLKLYKFLIDSYLKRCDTKILFVLFSKFDLVVWLDNFHPKLQDITQLLYLILQGLESWSQPDSSLLQDLFRRHLVHIFNHDFPEHYGEVLQVVLDRVSDQKLMPVVLLDLLNSMLMTFSCETIDLKDSSDKIQTISIDFARKQNLFNLKAATDSLTLFAKHFQKERLHHGLHGLYPKHKDYCQSLSAWFSCMGHVLATTAICTYQQLLADQIGDIVFGSLVEMYSPWLVTYTAETIIMQPTANWIKQLTENGKVLYPWSEQHSGTSKIMIKAFIKTLEFIVEHLPGSNKILDHTFAWYVHNFAVPNMDKHIYAPVHEGIATLPWEHFKPQPNYIDLLYESVQKFIPECHAMLGHIFIRIKWFSWFQETFPSFPLTTQAHTVSRLFVVFVKIAFEPNIHIHINTSRILEDAINYPWYLVEYSELESLLKWFVTTVEPTIILKLPVETNYTDRAVLELIRIAAAMVPEFSIAQSPSNATAKRILYTRSMVRLLRGCAAKNQRLLSTKDGIVSFNRAFLKLLVDMDKIVVALSTIKSIEECRKESLNLMIEILLPMQTQSEETSNQLIETLVQWIEQRSPGNLLTLSSLNAVGHMKQFIIGIYSLLEVLITQYLRSSEESKEWHQPTWANLMKILSPILNKLELMPIIHGPYLFTLHVFIIFKMEQLTNLGDKLTFLQDLSQLVEGLKTGPEVEDRLSLVWGAIISRGCLILSQTEHAKKPLLMLARCLQIVSSPTEGWGTSILGAVGLKRESVTNKRKVLTRCMACVIFSSFPDTSTSTPQPNQDYNSAMRELSYLLANKKFQDVKHLIVKSISILNEEQLPELRDIPHLISRLIDLFYEQKFLTTIPEVWDFDYKLS